MLRPPRTQSEHDFRRNSATTAAHRFEHVLSTLCNLACVDSAGPALDKLPIVRAIVEICHRKQPLPDHLAQPALSALWVLLSRPPALAAFLGHDGVLAVTDAIAGSRSLDVHLAYVGIVRMLALSSKGLVAIAKSKAAAQVCASLRQHARSSKGQDVIGQALGVLRIFATSIDLRDRLIDFDLPRVLLQLVRTLATA